MGMMTHAGKDIEDLAPGRLGIQDAVGGEERESGVFGQIDQLAQPLFFAANMVALNFDEEVGVAEGAD